MEILDREKERFEDVILLVLRVGLEEGFVGRDRVGDGKEIFFFRVFRRNEVLFIFGCYIFGF